VAYESAFETFAAASPEGAARKLSFKKAGTLAAGDRPELYFFEEGARAIVVCISGGALEAWQRAHRYLSREEKIDVAGLFLKGRIEAGRELAAEELRIDSIEFDKLVEQLGISE
jgi:hypothetical protein